MEPQDVQVETRDSDVPCPYCKQNTRKTIRPDRPHDGTSRNAENTTDLLGQAICDNPECHYKKDVIFWFYKT